MKWSNKQFLNLESLEERLTPAFDFFYNPSGDIWTVTQVQDDGDATITVDGINDLVIDDGAGGPVTVGVALGSLTVNMMDNSSGDVSVTIDGPLSGNVTVNLGNGGDSDGDSVRDLDFDAALGSLVFGNLRITGGTGDQEVELSTAGPMDVGGTINIDLGLGDDTVAATNGFSSGSSTTMNNVNYFAPSPGLPSGIAIGGSLFFNASRDNIDNLFDVNDEDLTVVIGGSVSYIGGNGDDDFILNDTGTNDVTIGGNVSITTGNNISGGTQDVALGDATIGGGLTVRGGTISGDDNVSTLDGAIIGGNIYVNTGMLGDTGDTVSLLGTNGGSSITIITSIGDDDVTYGMIGSNARLYASLGLGNDTFTLEDNVTLFYLYVDFGFGSDLFVNNYIGPFPFRVYLRNLP